MTQIHPGIAHVSALLGTWTGSGHGEYPTIDAFDYVESVTFSHVGKPFLAYQQRTRSVGAPGQPGQPMHAESGFWRFPSPGRVEVVLSHPTGVIEVEEGTIEVALDGTLVLDLSTSSVALSATAKSVTGVQRVFRLKGETLSYDLSMAAVGLPMQHHLAAELVREQPD